MVQRNMWVADGDLIQGAYSQTLTLTLYVEDVPLGGKVKHDEIQCDDLT